MSGTTVGSKKDGQPSNIRYRTVELTRDSSGLSTQMVTFRPHPLNWHRFVSMNASQRFAYERFLCTNRTDLHDFLKLAFDADTVKSLHGSPQKREIVSPTEGTLQWVAVVTDCYQYLHPSQTTP